MSKLTKSQKKELMKKVKIACEVIGKEFSSEEREKILNDKEKDRIHELGEKSAKFRNSLSTFTEEHYPDLKIQEFKRLVPLYLDMTGAPGADEKNRALLESLYTEEGKKKFAQQAVGDILGVNMGLLGITGNVEKDIKTYSAHAREIELCWAAYDLISAGDKYLDPKVINLLEDRLPMLQSAGDYVAQIKLAADDLYTVMPEISPEECSKIIEMENYDTPNNFHESELEEEFIFDLSSYNTNILAQQGHKTDKMGKVIEKAAKMEENGELTPFTIAKKENGEKVSLHEGIAASLDGEKITFEENTTDKPMIASYINEAGKKIRMPKEKNTSLYDTFSEEALSAQGKELQKECQRLSKIMDGAKLWYTGGSEQFRETDNLLKEMASGELLNKDQALEKMNKILAYCEKYISEKDEDTLKEREKKRLDAMKEVKKSLFPKRELLALIKIRGDGRRYEAAEGLGDKKQLFHTSTENQKNFHVAESDRKAAQYRKEVEGYRGERGVMGKLAADIEKTVTNLTVDTISERNAGYRPKIVTDSRLPRSIAEIAIFEFIREERALAKKHNETVVKGKTEAALDKLSANKDDWYKMIGEIADTKTVKKLAEDIANNSGKTAEFFTNQGPKKLLADLKKELTAKAPAANKENKQAEGKKAPEKKEMKKAGI